MIRLIAVSAAAVALATGAAVAQNAAARAGETGWLHGRWSGEGTVHGAPSRASLTVSPVLEGRFVELSYRFLTSGERPFAFEGRGLYSSSDWRGQWFDSTGATHRLTGASRPGELVSEWGDASTEQGRSAYRLGEDGALEVTDHVLRRDGRWHVFARHRLVRAE